MINNANALDYFLQAGIVVKLVMMILFCASILSWTLIIQRAWFFKNMKKKHETFKQRFTGSSDLNRLFSDIDSRSDEREGLTSIFYSGFKEFLCMKKSQEIKLEPIQRVMQIRQAEESEKLEAHLPIFASIGSIAPFVGLFGTVWGIMTSFQALGHAQQATIAMVAPGISEALVATALGLFTAIPAVIAFNRYTSHANSLLNRYDVFQEELLALITRQNYSKTEEISNE